MIDTKKVLADGAKAKSWSSAKLRSKRPLSINFALAALAGVALAGCSVKPTAGLNILSPFWW